MKNEAIILKTYLLKFPICNHSLLFLCGCWFSILGYSPAWTISSLFCAVTPYPCQPFMWTLITCLGFHTLLQLLPCRSTPNADHSDISGQSACQGHSNWDQPLTAAWLCIVLTQYQLPTPTLISPTYIMDVGGKMEELLFNY